MTGSPAFLVLFLTLACLLSPGALFADEPHLEAVLNGAPVTDVGVAYALTADHLVLKALGSEGTSLVWFRASPLQKTYEISKDADGKRRPISVEYELKEVKKARGKRELDLAEDDHSLSPGASFFGILTLKEFRDLTQKGRPSQQAPGSLASLFGKKVLQVVVRKDDTYMGYLTEMIHVPFGLAPVRVEGKNQTDLRVLVDCAEFALYGKRRQGYKVDYVGPKRIERYLKGANIGALELRESRGHQVYCEAGTGLPFSLDKHGVKAGDILHFGDQVSVFYEDKGRKGVLDPEDLMFYTYNNPPRISAIQDSEFKDRPLKVYRWKL